MPELALNWVSLMLGVVARSRGQRRVGKVAEATLGFRRSGMGLSTGGEGLAWWGG